MPLRPCPTGEASPGMSPRLPELIHKATPPPTALPALHASAFGSPSFPRPMKTRGWEMKLTPEAPHKLEINAHLHVYKNYLMLTSPEQLNSHIAHTQWHLMWGVGEPRQVAVVRGGASKYREYSELPSTQDVAFLLHKDPMSFMKYFFIFKLLSLYSKRICCFRSIKSFLYTNNVTHFQNTNDGLWEMQSSLNMSPLTLNHLQTMGQKSCNKS